jgi:tetratricopeptide (TPR) repeat protein
VGKTALAIHWAHEVADRFPDGQLYADLRGWGSSADPVPAADVLTRFLDALGVRAEQVPADTGARQDLYRSLLASKRMLIVLDNARDAAQVRPLLPGGRSCAVLVTSRSQLASLVAAEGAHPLPLDVLTAAEARQLLTLRLGQDRVAAEPDAAVELVELCARLPLALAIAASRAALHPSMPIAALACELRDAGGRLAVLDAGDGVSVQAVFSWSYQHLPDPARRMFRLLGLHPGPDISVAAATSLAGTGSGQAGALLGQLTEASLLTEHVPGRFCFHDLLRGYAAQCAQAEDGQRAAIQRTADHYLYSAHAADLMLRKRPAKIRPAPAAPGVTPEQPGDYRQALAWFESEQHVLTAVVEQAISTGLDTHGWQLPLALVGFYDCTGHNDSSLAIQQAALGAAHRLDDHEAQAQIQHSIGTTCLRMGALEDAERHHRQALHLCEKLGDQAGQAHAHLGLCTKHDIQGRYRDALSHASIAVALSQSTGDQLVKAAALNNLGWSHTRLGDYQQALPYCRQAIAMLREAGEAGDQYLQAHAWDSLGYTHHQLAQHAEAVSSYEQALALFRLVGDRFCEAAILDHLGDAHQADGKPELARHAWQQAVAVLEERCHQHAREIRGKLQQLM